MIFMKIKGVHLCKEFRIDLLQPDPSMMVSVQLCAQLTLLTFLVTVALLSSLHSSLPDLVYLVATFHGLPYWTTSIMSAGLSFVHY